MAAHLSAKKRKKHQAHTPQPEDKSVLPVFEEASRISKRLRETGPVAERDPLADASTPVQADTPSSKRLSRRSPRTPDIEHPPRVRPKKKLTFVGDEAAREIAGVDEDLARSDSLEQCKQNGEVDSAKIEEGSLRKSSTSLATRGSRKQAERLVRERLPPTDEEVSNPPVGQDNITETIVRRKSSRLVKKDDTLEIPRQVSTPPKTTEPPNPTQSRKKDKDQSKTKTEIQSKKRHKDIESKKKHKDQLERELLTTVSSKSKSKKKYKIPGKAGGKLGSNTQVSARKKWLQKVVMDRMRFKIGDDVYVRRMEEDFEEEAEGCLVCGKTGKLIECDTCSGGVHLKCMDPPLKEVPAGDWVCSNCAKNPSHSSVKEGEPSQPQPDIDAQKPRTAREMLMASQLWAARIERLWKDTDGSYWFKGRWYVIPEETAVGRQPHNLRRELFRTNHCDKNEVASILRPCYVMNPEEFRSSGSDGDDVYLCEYEYDTQFQTFKRISDLAEDAEASADEGEGALYPSEGDETDQSDDDMNQGKRWRSSSKVPENSQKSSSSTKAANARSGQMTNICKVGAKTIPQDARRRPVTAFERAKAALLLTAAPSSLPCREREMGEISAFVSDAVVAGDSSLGHCLYISGVPGTGKTATVLEVMQKLRNSFEGKNIQPYRFVEINGLRLTSPEHLYTVLHEALTGHHVGWKKALQLLDERFSNVKPSRQIDARPCILLIDELDLLVTRNQSVLYNIFEWPTRPQSRLFVIGVANTIDLPERLLPRIASRMGLQRVSFSPYSHEQLQMIISSRLEAITAFEKQAIEFASRKVAAVSGDARRALELCRRSVEIAESRCADVLSTHSSPKKSQGRRTQGNLVGMADVEEAIKEMFQAPHIKTMGRCTKQAKIFLVSMVYEQHKTGMVETTFEKVATAFSFICKSNNESLPDWDTLLSVGCGLGACRLIICEPGAHHRLQKLQLNFPTDDVSFALKEDSEMPWIRKYL